MTVTPYDDVPWLTPERETQLLADLEDDGACEFGAYEGKPDWDSIIDRYDSMDEPLPTDWDHPLLKKMKKAWRTGKRGEM